MLRDPWNPTRILGKVRRILKQRVISNSRRHLCSRGRRHINLAKREKFAGGDLSSFAGSFRFDGCFPSILGLCLQQGIPNTCELMFIAKKGEESRSQQHQLPKDELRPPPMIKHRHRRQRADEKETDLANTEQDMTQSNPMSKPDLRLKTASIPIDRSHYHKAKHSDGKDLSHTHHECSSSQIQVIRKRAPE